MIVVCGELKVFICTVCKIKSNKIIFPITAYDISRLSGKFRRSHRECERRNCGNCKFLGNEIRMTKNGPVNYFTCKKRFDGADTKEKQRLRISLSDEKYRARQKTCFEEVE